MADSTINGLTALSGANVDNTADQFAIWDNSDNTTKKITRTEVLTGIPAGTAAAPAISFTGDPDTGIYSGAANSFSISTGGSERVYVHTNGQVRLGYTGAVAAPTLASTTDVNTGIYFPAADNFGLVTGGVERLRIDSAGNVGLGVTPSAWTLPAFQSTYGVYSGTSEFNTSSNAYFDGQWKYISNSFATRYSHAGGNHYWFNKSAGTGTIAWSELMRLDVSGNLLVGTASANGSLTVVGAQSVDGSTYYIASLAANNAPVAGRGSGLAFRTNVGTFTPIMCAIEGVKENGTTDDYASALDFSTRVNGGFMTKRLRIKSTGQVNFVGLASDPAGAAAGDVYYNTTTNKLKCYNGTTWNDLF